MLLLSESTQLIRDSRVKSEFLDSFDIQLPGTLSWKKNITYGATDKSATSLLH